MTLWFLITSSVQGKGDQRRGGTTWQVTPSKSLHPTTRTDVGPFKSRRRELEISSPKPSELEVVSSRIKLGSSTFFSPQHHIMALLMMKRLSRNSEMSSCLLDLLLISNKLKIMRQPRRGLTLSNSLLPLLPQQRRSLHRRMVRWPS